MIIKTRSFDKQNVTILAIIYVDDYVDDYSESYRWSLVART